MKSMKSKVELKSEATTKLKAVLKDKAVEDFLKKMLQRSIKKQLKFSIRN